MQNTGNKTRQQDFTAAEAGIARARAQRFFVFPQTRNAVLPFGSPPEPPARPPPARPPARRGAKSFSTSWHRKPGAPGRSFPCFFPMIRYEMISFSLEEEISRLSPTA